MVISIKRISYSVLNTSINSPFFSKQFTLRLFPVIDASIPNISALSIT